MFLTGSIGASTERSPIDDFWYSDIGMPTASGMRVSEDRAMRTSAVYACVKILAESVGQLPLILYERIGEDGKRRATSHAAYGILHDQPNGWQTAFEFREMMQGHLALRGNAYALIDWGYKGTLQGLIPLHPGRVEPERLDNGRIQYRVRDGETVVRPGTERIYRQDEVHCLRGLSSDGLVGLSPIAQAREAVGMALSAEEYGARLLQNDGATRGIIEHPLKFKDDNAIQRFKRSWSEAFSGGGRHKTAVLEDGMKFHEIGMSNVDAQFLETRKYQVEDIARLFRMPLHMIGSTEKSTSWGTGIEQLTIGFVVYTLGPWLVRWEQAILRDLISQPGRYFTEFLVDGLLRGDVKSRYEAYGSAIDHGWLTRNEVRRAENRNPLDGLDEPLQPLNMTTAGARPDEAAAAGLAAFELAELRAAFDPEHIGRFLADTRDIYDRLATRMVETFGISPMMADTYCELSRNEIKRAGDDVHGLLDRWSDRRADELAAYIKLVKRA